MNERMETIRKTIKNVIRHFYPSRYLEYVFSGKITLDDIAMQIMMECCKYAYDYSAEKHSLRYYIGEYGLGTDNDRMMLQRIVQKINKYRQAEYDYRKEQTGIEIEGLLPKSMESMDDKLSGYEFNEFQFWEINDVHDLRIVDDIVSGKMLSKNYKNDTFRSVAEEYDRTVSDMIADVGGTDKNSLFSSLAIFTWEWKYAFDFYYKIAEEMDKSKVKFIPNMDKRCALFCGSVTVTSQLMFSHPHLAGDIIHTESRLLLVRYKFIHEFVDLSAADFERLSLQYTEAIFLVSNMLMCMTYQDINVREWFKENSTLEDWTDVMREYNVSQCFVEDKVWNNKRIRYVKEMIASLREKNKKS